MGNALINGEEFQLHTAFGKGDRAEIEAIVQQNAARGRCPNIAINVTQVGGTKSEAEAALNEINTKPPFPNLIMVGWIKQVWILGEDEEGKFSEKNHYPSPKA